MNVAYQPLEISGGVVGGFESRRPDRFSLNILSVSHLYNRIWGGFSSMLVTILLSGW